MNKLEEKVYTQKEINEKIEQLSRLLISLNAFGSLDLIDLDLITSVISNSFNFDISSNEY